MPERFARPIRVIAITGAIGFAWLAIPVPAVHGQVTGGRSVDPGIRVTGTSTAAEVQARIEAILAELAEQLEILDSLLEEYDALRDRKPTPPGPDASDAQKEAYQEAYAKWLEEVEDVQRKIERTRERIRELEQELEKLANDAGSARTRDREEARRLVASARYVERLRSDVSALVGELDETRRSVRPRAPRAFRRRAVQRTDRSVPVELYRDVRAAMQRVEETTSEVRR